MDNSKLSSEIPISKSLSPTSWDIFSRLPEEIRTIIASNLPTADTISLRIASSSFWYLFHNQQFWKTRFLSVFAERDWIFESADAVPGTDWRHIYRRTSAAHASPAMQNRKRVWALASRILDILRLQELEAVYTGPSVQEDPSADDNLVWTTVSGQIYTQPDEDQGIPSFYTGCRIIYRQRLSRSQLVGLSSIGLSFVCVGNTEYLAGLRFVQPGNSTQIGYRAPVEQHVTLNSPFKGWRLAVGSRGIQAVQPVYLGENRESPWLGSVANACITDRLVECPDICAMEFGLDVSRILLLPGSSIVD